MNIDQLREELKAGNSKVLKVKVNTSPSYEIVDGAAWRQGIGWVMGKPANDLCVGESVISNYGETSIVVGVVRETAKSIWLMLEYGHRSPLGVRTAERKFAKHTIVPTHSCFLETKRSA